MNSIERSLGLCNWKHKIYLLQNRKRRGQFENIANFLISRCCLRTSCLKSRAFKNENEKNITAGLSKKIARIFRLDYVHFAGGKTDPALKVQ